MSVTEKMITIAQQEWEYFGKQELDLQRKRVRKGRGETDDGFWQRVGVYWRDGTGKNLTGKNSDYPWSATFISYVLRLAGAADRFKYSGQHSVYIRRAIKARESGDNNYGFWGYRLTEQAPNVGDLICYSREPNISYETQSSDYKSHSDIVVGKAPGELLVIGGNVSNSVSLKHVRVNAAGKVSDNNEAWFAVLSNRFEIDV